MIKNDIKFLSGKYIVCRRKKSVVYYYRNCKTTSTYSGSAIMFDNLATATEKCKELNQTKKSGTKFKVEPAEKHFISDFRLERNYFSEKVRVYNVLHNANTYIKMGSSPSLNQQKIKLIETLKSKIENSHAQMEKRKAVQKALVDDCLKSIEEMESTVQYLNSTDLDKEFVEPNLTKTERTLKVLYGKKEIAKETNGNS